MGRKNENIRKKNNHKKKKKLISPIANIRVLRLRRPSQTIQQRFGVKRTERKYFGKGANVTFFISTVVSVGTRAGSGTSG